MIRVRPSRRWSERLAGHAACQFKSHWAASHRSPPRWTEPLRGRGKVVSSVEENLLTGHLLCITKHP